MIHGEMKQLPFLSKDMMEFYTVKTVFGSKMISTVEAMKLKYNLRQQEVLLLYLERKSRNTRLIKTTANMSFFTLLLKWILF